MNTLRGALTQALILEEDPAVHEECWAQLRAMEAEDEDLSTERR